jgi:pimeloyl-ACP methyl ester carboxylesterase
MNVFSSGGVDIAYIDLAAPQGPNEPILLIHGFASTHRVNWIDPSWTRTLGEAGYRVIALDNRGHGQSGKPYDPAQYHPAVMAGDAVALLDHLGIEKADLMGYSMGARIAATCAATHPERVRSLLLGGLGIHLVEGEGLPPGIADALEAPVADGISEPTARMFRLFAERNGSDLRALAACIRGSRASLTAADLARVSCPVLVSVGTRDPIAGDPHRLAALFPNGTAFDIPDRDHNLAVGDRTHKARVLEFLAHRP